MTFNSLLFPIPVPNEHRPELKVMYGGSVNENNICSLKTDLLGVAGVLVGGASLSADSFSQMIKNLVGFCFGL